MFFIGAGQMGVKADTGQGIGGAVTLIGVTIGFIESHPVLMSLAIGVIGLTIQGVSVYCSLSSKRESLMAKIEADVRREIEAELAAEAIEKTDLVPPEEGRD